MTSEAKFRAMLAASFTGELSPAEARRLAEHLAGCEGCRSEHDRMVAVERHLGGDLGRPAAAELERVEARVFAALDAEARPRDGAWARRLAVFATPLAAAAALAIALVPRGEDETLVARGGGPAARGASIRAFCLEGEAVRPISAGAGCSRSGRMKLSLANPGQHPYAFVVGLQADLSPRWYVPRPPEEASAPAPAAAEGEVPFGPATRLEVNHAVGRLWVYAMFSERPITRDEVLGAIAKVSGVPPLELPLGRADVTTRRTEVEIGP